MTPFQKRLQRFVPKNISALFRTTEFRQAVLRITGGTPPGGLSLEDLTNVSPNAPSDTEVLTFDAAQGLWIPATGGSGTIPNLQSVMGQGATYVGASDWIIDSIDGLDRAFIQVIGNNEIGLLTTDGTSGAELSLTPANMSLVYNTIAGPVQSMTWNDTAMTVTDPKNTKGLEYSGAYKANFTTYSLVDKDYVDTQIAGIGTPTPTLQQVLDQSNSADSSIGAGTVVLTDSGQNRTATYGNENIITDYGFGIQVTGQNNALGLSTTDGSIGITANGTGKVVSINGPVLELNYQNTRLKPGAGNTATFGLYDSDYLLDGYNSTSATNGGNIRINSRKALTIHTGNLSTTTPGGALSLYARGNTASLSTIDGTTVGGDVTISSSGGDVIIAGLGLGTPAQGDVLSAKTAGSGALEWVTPTSGSSPSLKLLKSNVFTSTAAQASISEFEMPSFGGNSGADFGQVKFDPTAVSGTTNLVFGEILCPATSTNYIRVEVKSYVKTDDGATDFFHFGLHHDSSDLPGADIEYGWQLQGGFDDDAATIIPMNYTFDIRVSDLINVDGNSASSGDTCRFYLKAIANGNDNLIIIGRSFVNEIPTSTSGVTNFTAGPLEINCYELENSIFSVNPT